MNVALYRLDGGAARWAMTERGRGRVRREANALSIGTSALSWDGDTLVVRVDEMTAPVPSRIQGVIRVRPAALTTAAYALDSAGRHLWRPIAPRARVEIALTAPDLRWSGDGYLDTNAGDEPLEQAFHNWDWARAHRARDVMLYYETKRRDGTSARMALRIDAHGDVEPAPSPPRVSLPATGWRMTRRAWGHPDERPRVVRTLEDTPFYARSLIDTMIGGERAVMMHESLSLDRLRLPVVRAMLPFRMPRLA